MMRQLALDPSSGKITARDISQPRCGHGSILVRSAYSVISTGTELAKVSLAEKPAWEKARERPDQVAKVLESIQTEGLVATVQKVRQKLSAPVPLGYSMAGQVIDVGEGCGQFRVGMHVACGGASAGHAEIVSAPANLAVSVPDGVRLEDACFATIGSVAMHGIRTGAVALGDRVLIIGLGLIGQLATRLCVAAGAHVFGVDPRRDRVDLALGSGAETGDTALDKSTSQQVLDWTHGRGADVVLITAGGADNQPLVLAGAAARDRARVVVVGAVSLDVPREPFYEKELSLIVSRSYGPGRYDPEFEEKGMTYPIGFVPWSERRNMEEFLSQLGTGRISLDGLHGVTIPFERAAEGYELLSSGAGASPISVVLDYGVDSPDRGAPERSDVTSGNGDHTAARVDAAPSSFTSRPLHISFIGLGNFASSYLLPAARAVSGVTLEHVVTATPLKAESARRRAGFRHAGTDPTAAISSAETEVVFIATRHDSHARYAEAALTANKAVFVEKPLALTDEQLARVEDVLRATQGRLMVGFNRRFAPATQWALDALGHNRAGLRYLCRVNAGPLPRDHWLLDPDVGGGRLIGEACHFIDLACFVTNAEPTQVEARALDASAHQGIPESFRIEIAFQNGATAGIDYLSGGDSALPKERVEIHRSGTSIVIDDFRSATLFRGGRRRSKSWGARDKGHRAEVRAFLEVVRTGAATPIPEDESIRSTKLTLAAARSIRLARPLRREEW